jgi:hypothetical protein
MKQAIGALLLLVFIPLSTPYVVGADPKTADLYPRVVLVGPSEVQAGNAVFLSTVGTEAYNLRWEVDPPEASASFVPLPLYRGMTPDGKPIIEYAAFFSSPKPGIYKFRVYGAKGDYPGYAIHVLNNKGTPGPDPQPDPNPDPNPTPGKRFVLVIRETEDQSVEVGKILQGLEKYVKEKKHQWRFVDKDSEGAWLTAYKEVVVKAGVALPALVVDSDSSAGGAKEWVVPLPQTASGAIEAVKKHGG